MSDNPYESPNEENPAVKARSFPFSIGGVAIIVVLSLLVIALLLPAKRGAREAARRASCSNNLKQIVLALLNYEQANGTLPPAYTVDENGNRLHSWRTLILPYLEESELYETIDLSKPWDNPVNAKAREAMMPVYMCPSASHADSLTTYLAVVGPDCAFSGSTARNFSEVTDGLSKTLILVDVNSDRAVHWMSPSDISKDEILKYGPGAETNHAGIMPSAFLDGHVTSLHLDIIDKDELRAILTIAGGETISSL